jgi:hypothetical protein
VLVEYGDAGGVFHEDRAAGAAEGAGVGGHGRIIVEGAEQGGCGRAAGLRVSC